MNREPNETSLSEFLRPIRQHWLLLASVILIAVGASIAYSLSQKPVYAASATLSFQAETRDLGLVGVASTPTQTSDQLAAAGAQTVLQPSIAAAVRRNLHLTTPANKLEQAVTATVQPASSLVIVRAQASSAARAQSLANGFATAGVHETTTQVRQSYAAALKQLKRKAPPFPKGGPQALIFDQELYSQQLSRLQVLSKIASPVQVTSLASKPSTPISPKPVRNAVLAALLGLILGLIAVYIRDSFDRRLRNADDIESQFPFPVLGHVRVHALGQNPRQNGNTQVAAADWELFRIVRRNLDFLEHGKQFRSVVVTSSLPAEGKTTVATFLAFASAAAGQRTLLIECDLRRPTFAERLGLQTAPGLSDFVRGQATPEEILQTVRFGDPVSTNGSGHPAPGANGNGATGDTPDDFSHQLVCITAGSPTKHPVEILRSAQFLSMVEQVKSVYDLVVIDTPPLLAVVDTLELLPHFDAAILCVRVAMTTRQQASAGQAALARLPERPTGLVVTGTRRGSEIEYGYVGYYA